MKKKSSKLALKSLPYLNDCTLTMQTFYNNSNNIKLIWCKIKFVGSRKEEGGGGKESQKNKRTKEKHEPYMSLRIYGHYILLITSNMFKEISPAKFVEKSRRQIENKFQNVSL